MLHTSKSLRDVYGKTARSNLNDDAISAFKPSKFINKGEEIIYFKGIPPEKWDDNELYEFEKMYQEVIKRRAK